MDAYGNEVPHRSQHPVGSTPTQVWGTALELSIASDTLRISGGTEDGWGALYYTRYGFAGADAFRADAAIVLVLIGDEDRKSAGVAPYSGLSRTGVAALIKDMFGTGNPATAKVAIPVFINSYSILSGASPALGTDGINAYIQSGSTYTTGPLSSIAVGTAPDSANVVTHYYEMGHTDMATSGYTAWSLDILRAGGTAAEAFSDAFAAVTRNKILLSYGWHFDHWIVNGVPVPPGSGLPNPLNHTFTVNATITAVFLQG
jgi:hypothetical protein